MPSILSAPAAALLLLMIGNFTLLSVFVLYILDVFYAYSSVCVIPRFRVYLSYFFFYLTRFGLIKWTYYIFFTLLFLFVSPGV